MELIISLHEISINKRAIFRALALRGHYFVRDRDTSRRLTVISSGLYRMEIYVPSGTPPLARCPECRFVLRTLLWRSKRAISRVHFHRQQPHSASRGEAPFYSIKKGGVSTEARNRVSTLLNQTRTKLNLSASPFFFVTRFHETVR